jgi:hypothetical protein
MVLWWRKYLKEMEEFRKQGRAIFFLHEAWVNAGYTVKNVLTDTTNKSAK